MYEPELTALAVVFFLLSDSPSRVHPSSGRASLHMPRGVALVDGREGVASLPHVHAQGDDWVVTSAVAPNDESLLTAAVVECPLPGALGRFVLPHDAVFHMPRKRGPTTRADLDAVQRREAASMPVDRDDLVVHHVTVEELGRDAIAETHLEEEEEEEEDDDQEEECEEDGEPEEEEVYEEEGDVADEQAAAEQRWSDDESDVGDGPK